MFASFDATADADRSQEDVARVVASNALHSGAAVRMRKTTDRAGMIEHRDAPGEAV